MNWQYVEQQLEQQMGELFPHGEGRATPARVRHALNMIAKQAWSASRAYHLLGILTMEQALEQINARLSADGRRPISPRRLRAIAQVAHERHAVGRQISRNTWIFSGDELDSLMPGDVGRPRKK